MALSSLRGEKQMSLSISPFKAWLAAGVIFLAIEAAIQLLSPQSPFDRTNFLQFSFARDETPQRLFVFEKIKAFADSNPTIVQSGDSSGFYGIEPAVVMKSLPAGTSYVNMSCCQNLGFRGYYNLLDFILSRSPAARYAVLYVTPHTMPRPELWDSDGAALWGANDIKVFGNAVYQNFISDWRVLNLPSLGFRRQVTDRVFYIQGLLNQLDRPLLNNSNYLEFLKMFRQTAGWMPENDIPTPISPSECNVVTPTSFSIRTLSQRTYLEEVFDAYAELARRRHVTLVIAFQPVGCVFGTGTGSAQSREAIARFHHANPDVEIPFPLIETWPTEMFSVPAHVRKQYTDKTSDRLGQALAEIMARHGS
jgi:hypothetical protein